MWHHYIITSLLSLHNIQIKQLFNINLFLRITHSLTQYNNHLDWQNFCSNSNHSYHVLTCESIHGLLPLGCGPNRSTPIGWAMNWASHTVTSSTWSWDSVSMVTFSNTISSLYTGHLGCSTTGVSWCAWAFCLPGLRKLYKIHNSYHGNINILEVIWDINDIYWL